MPGDKGVSKRPLFGWAAVAIAIGAAAFWLVRGSAGTGPAPAEQGMVIVAAPKAGTATPAATAIPPGRPALPESPEALTEHVRQTYPMLKDVALTCDARGCALTATIPPPTGDAFLKTRQEMLLGGLAAALDGKGYRALGRVEMEEVDDNVFHIRLPVAPGA